MHRGQVVVGGQSLDNWIVTGVLVFQSVGEPHERGPTLVATFHATVRRRSKYHVLISIAQLAGGAVVVVRTGDDSSVDIKDQV